ncbi:hypothetical protein FM106_25180 [Brachybacterium faecium]|uniref:Protein RecA n=1 Tax=Brachybacterium faecium (strain ATCC 43885 / DSM 4810 / JCM 11609 / LMG 19847 / NBRC 14762 / NCIMB 9860 / 6-10) TaxID=446465 RepID=C7MCU7_BRAFD|nr:hypothetical protein [Brachybacterium faecium]ACU85404.1 hypothetical protein Bfae_15760 [Brachybacterium faecium DSM 4810]SLN03251.1 hypothetical protein FM106_25180 [Brachybacterium faecium]HJG52894.1 hypothetical protein [Brachybacterium faecium]
MSTAVRAAEPTEDLEQRLSRARAALGAAERSAARWGGRIDRTALRGENLEQGSADDGLGTRLSVPAPLSTLFPRGSLRAGSSVALEGTATTSLLLSLAVAAAGEDSWCAIAGMPDLGLRSALDAGLDPCRLALAPAEGEQRPQVLSALADGVGVLVLGPDLELAPALWRSLLGRARTADTLVLAAAPPGRADLTLRAAPQGWTGLGQGSGRLRRRRLEVTAEGRGIAGHRTAQVLLPQVGGMIAEAPQVREPARLLRPVRRAS